MKSEDEVVKVRYELVDKDGEVVTQDLTEEEYIKYMMEHYGVDVSDLKKEYKDEV